MEYDNNLGQNRGGGADPELSAESYENVDPGKELEDLKARRDKLQKALDDDPTDTYASDELAAVDQKISTIESQSTKYY